MGTTSMTRVLTDFNLSIVNIYRHRDGDWGVHGLELRDFLKKITICDGRPSIYSGPSSKSKPFSVNGIEDLSAMLVCFLKLRGNKDFDAAFSSNAISGRIYLSENLDKIQEDFNYDITVISDKIHLAVWEPEKTIWTGFVDDMPDEDPECAQV